MNPNNTPGTLSVVGTPIGNLEDISLRALRILTEVDTIFCEDTRVTKKLLSHYGIHTKTTSFHLSKPNTIERLVQILLEGKDGALVVDAGTPGISDPGSEVISYLRDHYPDISIVSVPGPSALTAALSIAGVKSSRVLFLGFPPQKKGRQTFFSNLEDVKENTVVFYESSHRLEKALATISEKYPDKIITIVKELTKIHEKVWSGMASELLQTMDDSELSKGEFVIIIPAN